MFNINKTLRRENVDRFLSGKGYKFYNDLEKQEMWLDWYMSKDKWYNYDVVTSPKKVEHCTRFSLGALSRVCTDWASLLFNDDTIISIDGSESEQNKLEEIFAYTNFLPQMQQFIERYFCVGTGALVFGRDVGNKVRISYVDGTRAYVIRSKNGLPEAAAFINQYDEQHTLISVHEYRKSLRQNTTNPYSVTNYMIDENGGELLAEQFGIPRFETYSHETFVWCRPAIARREDWTSVYGQSIFGAAIDQNKVLDIMFDGYANEFLMGRKRIFVSQDITTYSRDNDNVLIPTFDPNDSVFNMIPTISSEVEGDVNDMIKPVDMELRQQQYSRAIQDVLHYVASSCFLGSNYYQFTYDIRIQMTATQVISSNTGLYRNIRKQENNLGVLLKKAVVIMMALENITIDPKNIKIKWDDSIIIDEEVDKENDRQDVRDGLMSKVEYRMKWYGETEEDAQKMVAKIEPIDAAPEISSGNGSLAVGAHFE